MAASHCLPYHPHPAAALRQDQFRNTRGDIADNQYYNYYGDQTARSPEDYNKAEDRTYPPAYPSELLVPPPPYYRGRESADLSTLPPLPETPVEEDNYHYPDDVFGTYSVAGDRRPIRHEFDSDSEAFLRKQLGSESSNISAHSYSQYKTPLPHNATPKAATSRENRRSREIPQGLFSESPIAMGSGSSMLPGNRPIPEQYPEERHATKQKPREIVPLSDKREKSGGGMKKKIRHSLDKLNIRGFPWGSNDKLTSSSSTSVTSKSKKSSAGKCGIRRYSDSNAPASINSITSVLSKARNNRDSPSVRPGSSSSYDVISVRKTEGNSVVSKGWKQSGKLIKAYMGGSKDGLREGPMKTKKSEFGPWSTVATSFASPMNPHVINHGKSDWHRQCEDDSSQKSYPLDGNAVFQQIAANNQYEDYPSPIPNRDEGFENRTYQPLSTGHESEFHRTVCEYPVIERNPDNSESERYFTVRGRNQQGNLPLAPDICKAKGTWGLLRNVSNSPRRVCLTASNPASSYNSPYGSTETLLSSGSRARSKSTNKILDTTPQGIVLNKPVPPDIKMHPPPKLTPVSGKLIVNKNSDASSILRPTAFKPVAPAMKRISPPREHGSPLHSITGQGSVKSSPRPEIVVSSDAYNRNSSPNTDSGRNSTSSINGTTAKNGSYSASEGYESARVSSSTAHDQHSDKGSDSGRPTSSTAVTSPKNLQHSRENSSNRSTADDVMIRDLESKVRERENDIVQLQKSLEENEKTLSRVYDEREQISNGGGMYSSQMKTRGEKVPQSSSEVSHAEVTSTTSVGEEDEQGQYVEGNSAQSRLEDCQWTLQQKCGEISLLKRLLRESQAEANRRLTEVAAQRSINRDLREQWQTRDREAAELLDKLKSRDTEIIELERKLRRSVNSTPHSRTSSSSSATPGSNSVSFSSPPQSPMQRQRMHKSGKAKAFPDVIEENNNNNNGHADLIQSHLRLQAEVETLRRKLISAEEKANLQQERFDREKSKWNEEKAKVIRYQKKLQAGYVEVHKRSQELEEQVESLTEELQRMRKSSTKSEIIRNGELRFPTDI